MQVLWISFVKELKGRNVQRFSSALRRGQKCATRFPRSKDSLPLPLRQRVPNRQTTLTHSNTNAYEQIPFPLPADGPLLASSRMKRGHREPNLGYHQSGGSLKETNR